MVAISMHLLSTLQESFHAHAPALRSALDKLAALSDSPVEWCHGRGLSGLPANCPDQILPHVWCSAHEASLKIAAMVLHIFVDPLEGHGPREQFEITRENLERKAKAFAIPIDELAKLQMLIRRERAKYIAAIPKRSNVVKEFTAASEAAEHWINSVSLIADRRMIGKPQKKSGVTPDEDEIAMGRQIFKANPKITRDELRKQMEIGSDKTSALFDVLRKERVITRPKRKSAKRKSPGTK